MGKKLLALGFSLGALLIVVGICGIFLSGDLIKNIVTSSLKLVPGSELYDQWVDPPIEVNINFYLFTIKNGPEFEKGATPVVEEIGPIVYREHVVKENLINNPNGTISYAERKYYVFNPDKSAYPENYTVTSLNMAAITIITQIRYMNGAIHFAVNEALKLYSETLLIKKTIREIMFGYEDEFLKAIQKILPHMVPTYVVGLFIGKNDTIDGYYNADTGEKDYNNLGVIKSYNGQTILSTWPSKFANMLNGTDGTLIAPFVNESKVIYIFVNDLCRSLYTVYSDYMYTYDNIKLLGFAPDSYFFLNASQNPDNDGFCTPPGNCLPAGVLNLTDCLGGIPIIQSSPHFLYCDDKYLKEVIGLKPVVKNHRTQLYVEPTSGVLMKANKRIQFNVQLFKDSRISVTQNLPEVLFPLMWVDENFEIDKINADKFYYEVKVPLLVLEIGKYVILAIGVAVTLALVYFVNKKNNSEYEIVQQSTLTINTTEQEINEKSNLIEKS